MSLFLLRLADPMQSWGTQSRFKIRDTGLEPSKSGVIGLLCAAMGRHRDEPLDDLTALKMGVRVDQEGRIACDYQTALEVVRSDASSCETVLSHRYYLADADFLVGLEGERELLARLDAALTAPVWPLCLGRKSFVPGRPVRLGDGLRPDGTMPGSLESYPWFPAKRHGPGPEKLRLVLESAAGDGEPRSDVPLSFAERKFTVRYVQTRFCQVQQAARAPENPPCT